MTGQDSEEIGVRIALHLRKNHFSACHDIISTVEREMSEEEQPVAIAEMGMALQWVNILEGLGYMYVRDLDGIDFKQLLEVDGLGPRAVREIKGAIKKTDFNFKRAEEKRLKKEIEGWGPI